MNLTEAKHELTVLRSRAAERDRKYLLNRQAFQGNFRWPTNWPSFIDRVTYNMCKPIVERFTAYLMGKGFSYNVERPNTLEFRQTAERAEKILARILQLSNGDELFTTGAHTGSLLGRTVYKVYVAGTGKRRYAAFTMCEPDYIYTIDAGTSASPDPAVVYYTYTVDRTVAEMTWGKRNYQTERQQIVDRPLDYSNAPDELAHRRIPVLEVWTKTEYALEVGGQVLYNGPNPMVDPATDEPFIPFVIIENIRNAGAAYGESDIEQSRVLNERLNVLLSRKLHIANRYLQPTLVWEGAPTNYAELLRETVGGGGALPTRPGTRLYFLAHDRPSPSVVELAGELRRAILEVAGLSEISYQGTPTGSINTGVALAAQFAPALSVVERKRLEWTVGLQKLFGYLLATQERIGDSEVLGLAAVNETIRSKADTDGEIVALSGTDIKGLREVSVVWPEILPTDAAQQVQLELAKFQAGVQSIYTTLERIGHEYPDDEVARLRLENTDPSLRGQAAKMQAETAKLLGEQAGGEFPPEPGDEMEEEETGLTALLAGDAGGSPPVLEETTAGPKLRY